MLAIPVATINRSLWESSHEACTSAFRPRPSGIHSAPYPRSSTRRAKAAAAAAFMPSIPTQTPSLPSSIAGYSFKNRLRVVGARLLLHGTDRKVHGDDAGFMTAGLVIDGG